MCNGVKLCGKVPLVEIIHDQTKITWILEEIISFLTSEMKSKELGTSIVSGTS